MTGPAAKGRKLFSLVAAIVTAAATLLVPTPAGASRYLPSASNRTIAPQPSLETLAAGDADRQPAFPLLTATDRRQLAAAPASRPASNHRFSLFSDLAPGPGELAAWKLASGSLAWEVEHNVWSLHEIATETWWRADLYQAFGFDAINVTDPWGMCAFGLPCPERVRSAGEYTLGAVQGLFGSLTEPATVVAPTPLRPLVIAVASPFQPHPNDSPAQRLGQLSAAIATGVVGVITTMEGMSTMVGGGGLMALAPFTGPMAPVAEVGGGGAVLTGGGVAVAGLWMSDGATSYFSRTSGESGQASREAGVTRNMREGGRRERETEAELTDEYPDASVQREQYLRDENGLIVRDPLTGRGRRVDHVVVQEGEAAAVVETTSPTANKAAQIAKERRIREAGGNYVRDRDTGELVDLQDLETEIRRRD